MPVEPNKPMPPVSDAFMEWLKSVPIPEIVPFATLDGTTALKQVAFGQGILHLKRLIHNGMEAHKSRIHEVDTRLPKEP